MVWVNQLESNTNPAVFISKVLGSISCGFVIHIFLSSPPGFWKYLWLFELSIWGS